ncbi:hypothetical protein QIS74_01024 [Colletotrichum tabaci]|uniref:Uncharacterized protein n=1 Tax=Colletotrichum tabaci TaxID=1209068 RepID=A0AAV9TVI3_9PEZI
MRSLSLLNILFILLLGAFAGILEDKGYEVRVTNGMYEVFSKHFDEELSVNSVKFSPDSKSMTIYRAYNGWEDAHPGKLRLSEVLQALCEEARVNPENFEWVILSAVMNDDTLNVLMKYVRDHNMRNPDSIMVAKGDAEWDEFANTPFVKAVDRILRTKSVNAFVARKGNSMFPDVFLSIG